MLRKPGRWRYGLALSLFTLAFAEAETVELALPGQSRERSITAEERHVYRLEATGSPLLITVEQRGIDLIVEARGPGDAAPVVVDAPNHAWGTEVLLLSGGAIGPCEIEIRSFEGFAAPGRYTLRTESLPARTADDARRSAALAAMTRGGQHSSGNEETLRQGLSAYREALPIWHALKERRWEAETLHAIAGQEASLDDLRAAAEDFSAVAALWRELGEPGREAVALGRLGIVHQRTGEIEAARQAQESALALWTRLGEPLEEARTRSEICLLEQTRGALLTALACYAEVQNFFHERGDKAQEAQILHNLGGVHDALGDPDTALAHYGKALALRRELGDRFNEARTLNNIAVIHRTLGEWQEALRVYGQVRQLAAFGSRAQEATLLNNVGIIYNILDEPERALTLLKEALELRDEVGDRRGKLVTLNNLGLAWRKLGDPAKALDHHRQALTIAIALEDAWQQALTRLRLVEVALDQGDSAGALREIAPALAYLKTAGLRRHEAEALQLQGRALTLAGQPREALPVFREALEARRAVRDRVGEAETLHALATAERALDLRDTAYTHAMEAVTRVEELRTGFVSPDLRAAFLATQRRAYALLLDLLMDRHALDPRGRFDREALRISEQARARNLLDALLSGDSPAGPSVPAALFEQRLSLRRRLSARLDRQVKQSVRKGAPAETLDREIEKLQTELDSLEAEIRSQDPQYAALRQPQPIEADGIATLLEPGTLLVEYALGEEQSYLWVVGAGSFHSFLLPSQREIETLARQVVENLSTIEAGSGPQDEAAQALGRLLLSPFWNQAAGTSRLVIVPDSVLHYVPFSALLAPAPGRSWDTPRSRLLEHLEVVSIPSATTLALQRQQLTSRSPAPKWAAVLADPVFSANDPRLAAPARPPAPGLPREPAGAVDDLLQTFEPLPASRREAEAIQTLAPAGQVWTALGLEASRETVVSGKLRDYRILHFATHGIADSRNAELSGLVLSLVDTGGQPREGFLGLSDIFELDLHADLVVLSGCRTALGREVGGEGLMGLTRAFQHAGVPRVVAGLWRVQDRTTAELMTRFYQALWQDHLSPAAALRQAQLSLRSHPPYKHPYHWAGFVLQGDWR
jgi:CHAT domain-containing protein/tetratricopeptide (TPR) repeat protein